MDIEITVNLLKEICQYGILAFAVVILIFRPQWLLKIGSIFTIASYLMITSDIFVSPSEREFSSWLLRTGLTLYMIHLATCNLSVPKYLVIIGKFVKNTFNSFSAILKRGFKWLTKRIK